MKFAEAGLPSFQRRLLSCRDPETEELCVIDRKRFGDGGLWVRPLSMFLRKVDKGKNPNAPPEYRFELQDISSKARHGTAAEDKITTS